MWKSNYINLLSLKKHISSTKVACFPFPRWAKIPLFTSVLLQLPQAGESGLSKGCSPGSQRLCHTAATSKKTQLRRLGWYSVFLTCCLNTNKSKKYITVTFQKRAMRMSPYALSGQEKFLHWFEWGQEDRRSSHLTEDTDEFPLTSATKTSPHLVSPFRHTPNIAQFLHIHKKPPLNFGFQWNQEITNSV